MRGTLVLLLILAVLGLSVWLGMRYVSAQNQARQRVLQDLAARQGWTWRPPEGSRVFGIAGVGWILEGRTLPYSRNTSGNVLTVWSHPHRGAGTVVLGPRLPGPLDGMDLSSPLVQRTLAGLLSDETLDLTGLTRQPVGSAVFQGHYDVLTSDAALAQAVVSAEPALVRLAQALGGTPVVLLTPTVLELRVRKLIATEAEALALVEAGQALSAVAAVASP